MKCAICCDENSEHVKLPCFTCKGHDKAYCFTCFGSMASYHLNTFNLIIDCPYCRCSIEFNFQHNDSVVVSQNGIPYCTLLNTSELANYIVKGYASYCKGLKFNTDAELEFDNDLNRLIHNENKKIQFRNFLNSRTIGTSHDIIAPERVVLMPVAAAYTWFLNNQNVLNEINLISSTRTSRSTCHHTHNMLSTLPIIEVAASQDK